MLNQICNPATAKTELNLRQFIKFEALIQSAIKTEPEIAKSQMKIGSKFD